MRYAGFQDGAEEVREEDRAEAYNNRERRFRGRGFFVAFGYTKDAEREAAAFYKRTPPERIIKLLTVQEILDEEHVQKMWFKRSSYMMMHGRED